MSQPVDRAFVRIAEGQVHLHRIDAPDADKPPVLLLHASPASSRFMVPLMQALADSRRMVIAPDTLGNGDSPAPVGDAPDIGYFANSMIRLADAMGIDRFDVYGSHTGARIACELAAAYPDRVRRAVFDGITEYDSDVRQRILDNYAPTVAPDDYGQHLVWAFNFVRDQALYFPYFDRRAENRLPGDIPPASVLNDVVIDVLKALGTYHKPYLAAFTYPAFERMKAIERPVLLLRAAKELAVLNKAITTALESLRNGRSVPVESDAAAKAAAMREFFDAAD
ncbi:alpha/beta fold hydrolase [Sphingobium sp. CR2-8]|uniref:alpha/beta hydrolase n=1 Tax=Sphingobium sp. CR2-8 TaxID=1306534 RepID=UPI002DB705D2|nr:alpha/beta fold hydrolase [Sphingobium sp. CR2-8]MEC3911478.1 alpha/beta fold hydrolase [Sphingobium sp. CR2-8]